MPPEAKGDGPLVLIPAGEGLWLHAARALVGAAREPRIVLSGSTGGADVTYGDVERLLRALAPGPTMALVDLTAYRELAALVEGTALVGQAGRTREAQLVRLARELPGGHALGVVLFGGKAR
jgi:hypothetical protein